jgi:hypothetical protein
MYSSRPALADGATIGAASTRPKPAALVVFLENVGHVQGVPLPKWATNAIDFLTEEYAKLLLRIYGAYRRYERVIILEDALATGPRLVAALVEASRDGQVDLLLLVHGHPETLVGHRGQVWVGPETFKPLLAAYRADPTLLNLRMVFGLNCFGVSLAPTWLALGAQATNGTCGVNWLPEPSLSVFLRNWLGGQPFSVAVQRSHEMALRWGMRIWRPSGEGKDHPYIAGSRQAIFGVRDVTVNS